MRRILGILILFYFIVTVLWIANSPYLFSQWGLIIWLFSIGLGVITIYRIKEKTIMKKIMLYSTSFMVLLLIATGFIYITVNAMP